MKDVLVDQETRFVASLQITNEAASSSLTGLATEFGKDVGTITHGLKSSLAEIEKNTVVALLEGGEGSIAAVNNLALSHKAQMLEMNQAMTQSFQALFDFEARRSL